MNRIAKPGDRASCDDKSNALECLFRPRSVAVIGASTDPTKIGGRPIALLRDYGFTGAIHPVNPKANLVQGIKAYATIKDIPDHVDLAIVAVPGAIALGALEECARSGVGAAVVFSGGFAETGEAGQEAQTRLTRLAQRSGMRIVGPNCLGLTNLASGLAATFLAPPRVEVGRGSRIAVASQSGAVGAIIARNLTRMGLAPTIQISTGNEADIQVADCIAHFADDPLVDVIAVYLEGVRDGSRLLQSLERARCSRKPVVVLKVGESTLGAAAVSSHTAAVAGRSDVFAAILRQFGAYKAKSLEELSDVAAAAAMNRFPTQKRLCVVSASGGLGALMSDAAAEVDLEMTELPEGIQAQLLASNPMAAVRNPVDVTGQVANQPGLADQALELVADPALFDVMIVAMPLSTGDGEPKTPLFDIVLKHAKREKRSLFVACTATTAEERDLLIEGNCVVFEDASRAVRAVAAICAFGEAFEKAPRQVFNTNARIKLPRKPLDEFEAGIILKKAGLPIQPTHLVRSGGEAADVAAELGFPVAMKICSPDIQHKSDLGGVVVEIADTAETCAAFDRIMLTVQAQRPLAELRGALVSKMRDGGIEMILGAVVDPEFGSVVMVGAGGVLAELFQDASFRLAPVARQEANEMLREIKIWSLLDGPRGRPPCDVDALIEAIVDLSEFAAAAYDDLVSVELNPVLVGKKGEGVVALDALIVTLGPGAIGPCKVSSA